MKKLTIYIPIDSKEDECLKQIQIEGVELKESDTANLFGGEYMQIIMEIGQWVSILASIIAIKNEFIEKRVTIVDENGVIIKKNIKMKDINKFLSNDKNE